MINFYSAFINCNSSRNATLDDVVDHIQHIRKVIGSDHIGIGGDYDGVDSMPTGLEDVSKYPYLIAALIERGWSMQELKKLLFTNLIRVMREVEKIGEHLRSRPDVIHPPMYGIIPKQELQKKGFSDACLSSKALPILHPE